MANVQVLNFTSGELLPDRVNEFLEIANNYMQLVVAEGELIVLYIEALRQHQIVVNSTGISEQRLRQIFEHEDEELNYLA